MGSGIDKRALESSVYDVLLESATIAETRRPSPKGGYDVVGANRELAGAEVELVELERRDKRLKGALAAVQSDYDFVLIDCPPSLSLLTLNGLCCAHGVIVPMQCEYFRARRPERPGQHHQAGARQPQPGAGDHRPAARDVRSAHHAAAAGQRAAQGALRRQGVQHRDPAQRAPGRGAQLRLAGRGVRSPVPRAHSVCRVRARDGSACCAARGRVVAWGAM